MRSIHRTMEQTHGGFRPAALFFVLLQVVIFSISVCLNLNFRPSPDSSSTANRASLISRAAIMIIHKNAAIVLLPQCPTMLQLFRPYLPQQVIDISSRFNLEAVFKLIAWSLVAFTYIHVLAMYVFIAEDSRIRDKGLEVFLVNTSLHWNRLDWPCDAYRDGVDHHHNTQQEVSKAWLLNIHHHRYALSPARYPRSHPCIFRWACFSKATRERLCLYIPIRNVWSISLCRRDASELLAKPSPFGYIQDHTASE